MRIAPGKKIPSITIMQATPEGNSPVDVSSLFAGKKVVLFSVIGAFTSDCTQKHLPSYLHDLPQLEAKGVDLVACLAVNDVEVVRAWAEQHGALGKIAMLADGSGLFTRALGIELDLTKFGMGMRADRGVLIVDDGVVMSIDLEAPMQFDVSSASACLRRLG